jgi:hypothetical protein
VAERYAEYGAVTVAGEGPGRQIWHTPTELFKVRRLYFKHCSFNSCIYNTALLRSSDRAMSCVGVYGAILPL